MKAMILAAGRGERMRELTLDCPKPLLKVRGEALIVWQIKRLASAGIRQIVINLAYRGQQIADALGDGSAWGVQIEYSREESALETAGGIVQALPLLGDAPFFLLNADVWCEVDYRHLLQAYDGADAFLFLVPTPSWKSRGDFNCVDGEVCAGADLTFSGLSIWKPEMFAALPLEKRPLIEVLRPAVAARRVRGQLLEGVWDDVGTPERLQALQ